MKYSNRVKGWCGLLTAVFLLSGCAIRTVHEEYKVCRTKAGQFEVEFELRASFQKNDGVTVYGSPYDVVVFFRSTEKFSHGGVANIALSETGSRASAVLYEGSMAIMKAKKSENLYWAYGKETSVKLPYKSYALTGSVVLNGDAMEFHCQLQKNYKEYEEGFFEAVWGGI
jgi:hypothetical protein